MLNLALLLALQAPQTPTCAFADAPPPAFAPAARPKPDTITVASGDCASVAALLDRYRRARNVLPGTPVIRDLAFLDADENGRWSAAEVRSLCKYVVSFETRRNGQLPYERARAECK